MVFAAVFISEVKARATKATVPRSLTTLTWSLNQGFRGEHTRAREPWRQGKPLSRPLRFAARWPGCVAVLGQLLVRLAMCSASCVRDLIPSLR
jgi:hypothetical protein